jgi:serine/threonine-protein kinase
MIGTVFEDRYELEALLGRGGMASVYRARDSILGREVALKVLHAEAARDPELLERFRREARSAANLGHRHIATMIDRGEHDGVPYIVFEYLGGGNLKQLIRRGEVPIAKAVDLAIQVALGLEYAHRAGLVHRDVKPQNILLDDSGQAKVIDFGIARAATVHAGLTGTGTVLGTSDYIAPEQAQGRRVEERTDVYSLGVVLYELLTGEVPFPGENFVAVAMRHINEEAPSPAERRKGVSPRLDAAVRWAMAKDPNDRPTTLELIDELEQCRTDEPGGPDEQRTLQHRAGNQLTRPSWALRLLLLGVVALAAIAGYAVLSSHPGGKPQTVVPLSAIGAYDPYGTNGENDAIAPRATDGKVATYWETERYRDAPSLDKPGVGLVLDAGSPVTIRRLTVITTTPGFSAEIKAGDAPTRFAAVVGGSRTVAAHTTFVLHGRAYRYYLLWITRLGAFDTARVSEVRAVQ